MADPMARQKAFWERGGLARSSTLPKLPSIIGASPRNIEEPGQPAADSERNSELRRLHLASLETIVSLEKANRELKKARPVHQHIRSGARLPTMSRS